MYQRKLFVAVDAPYYEVKKASRKLNVLFSALICILQQKLAMLLSNFEAMKFNLLFEA